MTKVKNSGLYAKVRVEQIAVRPIYLLQVQSDLKIKFYSFLIHLKLYKVFLENIVINIFIRVFYYRQFILNIMEELSIWLGDR